jgi:hypothetical protein
LLNLHGPHNANWNRIPDQASFMSTKYSSPTEK